MLAGVLLHVIEAARPVDSAPRRVSQHRLRSAMRNLLALVDDFDHRRVADRAGIKRLTAGGWIKRGAIQINAISIVAAPDNASLELAKVGVVVIKPVGHFVQYNGFTGSMSLPRLELRRVSKTYQSNGQSLRALYDISLTVEAGSVTALVGRSGCGKTTLLNLAGAMDFPTSGDVLIDESALTALRRKRIGFVFQFFQLLPALTVLENVELPLLLAGAPDSRTAARDRLQWVGLEDKASALPYQLSGGQAQRTAIARALVHAPDILIADEPTGNLDTASGEQVLNLIRESAQRLGAAVLMATHSSEAAAIAQTQIRLRDGHIEEMIRA